MHYALVEKLALAVVQVVQCFRHYILLRTATVISECNPMTYIPTRQLLGGKYSKWILILQEFDLVLTTTKSKKSLVFAELICSLPSKSLLAGVDEQLLEEILFLISTLDPWYSDIIMYLQTSTFRSTLTKDDHGRIRHHSQPYRIIGNTLYHVGFDSFLCQCLTIEKAERVLNDCHSRSCGDHMSGYTTAQKILRASCFWPSIFKDCILVVHKCHECQIYERKMCAPPAQLHPVITIGPFAKWAIDYMTYGKTTAQFLFNHVISRFNVPHAIITDHGSHFRDYMMAEMTFALSLCHDGSTPYYPQANDQVEAVNKALVTILQHTIGMHKSNWHLMLFSSLWPYRTSTRNWFHTIPAGLWFGNNITYRMRDYFTQFSC
eukprot:PITA_03360